MSNSLLCLLPRRDDWNALCNDPKHIPNALEEVLRFESPQTSWRRMTNIDTSIAGVQQSLISIERTLENISRLGMVFTFAWGRGWLV